MSGFPPMAELLADAARAMESEPEHNATLEAIVREAQKSIPGTDHAGLSVLENGRVATAAPTSELVEAIDSFQYTLQEGPCVDAVLDGGVYRTGNLARETRWPRFAEAASSLGVHSMLAFRLHLDGRVLGALNLYSTNPDAFDEESVYIGQPFAAHASIAVAHSRERVQLLDALDSRDVIGMAKGIIMQSMTVTDERAFSVLVALSQRTQEKLRTVAEKVVEDARSRALHQPGRGRR
ncbi:GAF and ANTAR domain-containing protein [Lolliginicoccus suaedae]|uniref:GAF and ANTAR domain-containing protein n=1 Tax=Lolliginicoccus suaedae TaxID=2605429 RepID=UPI001CA7F1DD|nr:GAF and ANTAR domain-containing protein [Lolliginicoccus suaedae]